MESFNCCIGSLNNIMSTDEAKQLIEELEKLQRQTYRFRLLTIIAMLAIVIAGVSAIIESAYSLTVAGPRQGVFLSNLSTNLNWDSCPSSRKSPAVRSNASNRRSKRSSGK